MGLSDVQAKGCRWSTKKMLQRLNFLHSGDYFPAPCSSAGVMIAASSKYCAATTVHQHHRGQRVVLCTGEGDTLPGAPPGSHPLSECRMDESCRPTASKTARHSIKKTYVFAAIVNDITLLVQQCPANL